MIQSDPAVIASLLTILNLMGRLDGFKFMFGIGT